MLTVLLLRMLALQCAEHHPHPDCAGHSVNALQGRWQKNKDVYWYTRDTGDRDAAEAAELLAVKQREEDLMAEVLFMHANGCSQTGRTDTGQGGGCKGAQSGSLRHQIL